MSHFQSRVRHEDVPWIWGRLVYVSFTRMSDSSGILGFYHKARGFIAPPTPLSHYEKSFLCGPRLRKRCFSRCHLLNNRHCAPESPHALYRELWYVRHREVPWNSASCPPHYESWAGCQIPLFYVPPIWLYLGGSALWCWCDGFRRGPTKSICCANECISHCCELCFAHCLQRWSWLYGTADGVYASKLNIYIYTVLWGPWNCYQGWYYHGHSEFYFSSPPSCLPELSQLSATATAASGGQATATSAGLAIALAKGSAVASNWGFGAASTGHTSHTPQYQGCLRVSLIRK